jgi:propionyl-CoA carboxylase alpha chain
VFLERYLVGARHVEVQVFGDIHGTVVHLFERECSIQRRHQKVVEEAPSPGVTDATREGVYAAAVAAAEAIGYVGAGTVEFLVFGTGEEQEYFFLEMNTRLQVEHPVTEAITGLDLVRWQLLIAQGARIPLKQKKIKRRGHAIEVRLYAEDPSRGYLPNTGVLRRCVIDESMVRVDTGVESGSEISAFYDPMIAKVISHGADRDEAARRLSHALRGAQLHGVITNRDSLVAVLEHPSFLDGGTTTAFLEQHREVLTPSAPDAVRDVHLLAAAMAGRAAAVASAAATPAGANPAVPPGWRNVVAVPEERRYADASGAEVAVRYASERNGRTRWGLQWDADVDWRADAARVDVCPAPADPAAVAVSIDDGSLHRRLVVTTYPESRTDDGTGAAMVVVEDGTWATSWTRCPRFRDASQEAAAHGPSTPVPGTVTLVSVAVGDVVAEGQTLVVLEAMKMEHRITADAPGVVAEVLVTVGESVDAHQVVVVLADDGAGDGAGDRAGDGADPGADPGDDPGDGADSGPAATALDQEVPR